MFIPGTSIQKMHVELRNTRQSWQLTQIPTNFKDRKEQEQAEFHSAQIVDVEVSIYPFFSKRENEN